MPHNTKSYLIPNVNKKTFLLVRGEELTRHSTFTTQVNLPPKAVLLQDLLDT